MNEFRAHYERLDTEELLELTAKDLTEEARAALEQVLVARGETPAQIVQIQKEAKAKQVAIRQVDDRLAPLSMRFVAFLIDWVAATCVPALVVFVAEEFASQDVRGPAYAVGVAYWLFRDRIPGQSLGKRMANTRVEMAATGKDCSWAGSFWRNLTLALVWFDILFIFGRRRMRLGDIAAGTQVVNNSVASGVPRREAPAR
jgi:uncharacterized RDD family membrane protein YckC